MNDTVELGTEQTLAEGIMENSLLTEQPVAQKAKHCLERQPLSKFGNVLREILSRLCADDLETIVVLVITLLLICIGV